MKSDGTMEHVRKASSHCSHVVLPLRHVSSAPPIRPWYPGPWPDSTSPLRPHGPCSPSSKVVTRSHWQSKDHMPPSLTVPSGELHESQGRLGVGMCLVASWGGARQWAFCPVLASPSCLQLATWSWSLAYPWSSA